MKTIKLLIVFAMFLSCNKNDSLIKNYNSLKDERDGQTYKTVIIDTLTWMAENLNYKVEDSWCYDNDESNGDIYGRLYTHHAALEVCPDGWRLPEQYEWKRMISYLGGEDHAGVKLKSSDLWYFSMFEDNESGFNALPSGRKHPEHMSFTDLGFEAYWWLNNITSTDDACNARIYYKDNYKAIVTISNAFRGYSVRCVKK